MAVCAWAKYEMAAFNVKWKHEILAVLVRFSQVVQVCCTWPFHVLVLQGMAKNVEASILHVHSYKFAHKSFVW